MSAEKGVAGWLKRVFGGTPQPEVASETEASPRAPESLPAVAPLPKDAPQPAPLTPAQVFKSKPAPLDDGDLDSHTIIPGPDSDAADMMEELRQEVLREREAKARAAEVDPKDA